MSKKHREQRVYEATHHILTSEIWKLEGFYHLFNLEKNAKLHIKRLPGSRMRVASKRNSLVLRQDDSFTVTRKSGYLKLIPGPSSFRNPFEGLIYSTVYSAKIKDTPDILTFDDQESFNLNNETIVIGFDAEIDQKSGLKERVWIGGADHEFSGYKILLVFNAASRYKTGKLKKVIIRSSAGEPELEWFRKTLINKDLIIRPSGAFAEFTA